MRLIYLKRVFHSIFGHNHKDSVLVETITSDKHPNSDWSSVYTINIITCSCGLTYNDTGLELRNLTAKEFKHALLNINNGISYHEVDNHLTGDG